jgi:hypothetical protein
MAADKPAPRIGEPTFGDYLKAAFNVRVHVPGLGGLPVNWLYLATMAGLTVAAWPMALVGAAGEVAVLATLSTNTRFQQAVRARLLAQQDDHTEATVSALVSQLTPGGHAKYQAFAEQCADVLQIARKLGQGSGAALDTYTTHLMELRDVYARMLVFAELLASYSRDWEKSDPLPEMAAIEKQIADGKLPDPVLASRKATLEILKKRAESRVEVSQRASVLHSEIERLEQQLALLRDQALLTRDPSVFSQSMDTAAGVLEEHNAWLKENEVFLQSLDHLAVTA